MQQKMSRLLFIVYVLAMLLPYGVVLASTWIFTTNQYWLFPIGFYVNDFGNWLGFGMFIPFFIISALPIIQFSGLVWWTLGLYVSRKLQLVYYNKADAKSLWDLSLRLLVVQVVATIIVSFVAWYGWLAIVVPLPLHFLIVLYLTRLRIQQVQNTQV